MTGRSGRRRLALALTPAAAVVAFAGCDDGGGDAATTRPTSTASIAAPTGSAAPADTSVPATTDGPRPRPPDDAPPGTAAPAAYAPSLRAAIEQRLADDRTPGAVVLVRSPAHGDWTAAFGTRRVGTDDPVTVDDVFRIGDVTAFMTATVLLRLQDQGRLSLQDPIGDYVAGIPGGDTTTLEQLGDYEGGLPDFQHIPAFIDAYGADPQRRFAPQELVDLALTGPIAPADDEAWSRTNSILLGMVIEQITGQSAADVFADQLATPLGLERIGLADADGTLPEPHAGGFAWASSAFDDPTLTADERAAVADGTRQPTDHTNDSASSAWTATGAYADADDLADLFVAAVDGPLLDADDRAIWDEMDSLGPDRADGVRVRFGLAEVDGYLYAAGSTPGYAALVAFDPNTKDTIVVLTNATSTPAGASPVAGIFESIRSALR